MRPKYDRMMKGKEHEINTENIMEVLPASDVFLAQYFQVSARTILSVMHTLRKQRKVQYDNIHKVWFAAEEK